MPAPPIESRVKVKSRAPTVISMSAPVVAAIHADVIHAVRVEGPRVVSVAAARNIGALHVAAVSRGDDAGAVALTDDRAAAADAVVNLHSVAIDGANLPIGTKARRASTLQSDRPARRSTAAHTASRGRRVIAPGRRVGTARRTRRMTGRGS